MINLAQYMTLVITISVVCLGIFLSKQKSFQNAFGTSYSEFKSSFWNQELINSFLDLLSSLKSITFYKVLGKSCMRLLSPSVFYGLDYISKGIESLNQMDPLVLYSLGGLALLIGLGIN